MNKIVLSIIIFFINSSIFAEDLVEFDYELDAYYTNASAFVDLDTANEITDASGHTEIEIYKGLVLNSLSPNIFLIETAVHPMSLVGMYYRDQNEELYTKDKAEDFNIVKTLTAGFEEPYSFSFFVGRMMVFKNEKDDYIGKNRAYIGYLISIGNSSIKDNHAHSDDWVEIEFKLKGTREKKYKDLDWSFRVGSKLHSNHDFVDTLYVGARRKSIDYKKSVYSFVYNSAFNTMIAVDSKKFNLTEAEFVLEKSIPLSYGDKMSFSLGLGYLYSSKNKYSGKLKQDGIDNHQLVFRPNFTW